MRYFELHEFVCPCCGVADMRSTLLGPLDDLREICGFPFIVNSGYRCERHNRVVKGATNSRHLYGDAVDIGCDARTGRVIVEEALKMGVFTGIGVNLKGGNRFVHLDTRPLDPDTFPFMWSY